MSPAIVLAAFLALLVQSFVVQPHFHLPLNQASPTIGATASSPDAHPHHSPTDPDGKCSLCQELAHSGDLLLAGVASAPAPAPLDYWLALSGNRWFAPTRRSHAWSSRAPPFPLHA